MDSHLRSKIENELQSGERIVWMGQPIPGRYARHSWALLVFGIPWTAFAVFWMAMASGTMFKGKGPKPPEPFQLFQIIFPLVGLPFVFIGLGMLCSPLWMRWLAGRIGYVITDRRALILSLNWRGDIRTRSFQPEALRDLQRRQNADGSGDLIFTQDWHANRGNRRSTDIGFTAVRDVKSVETHLQTLLQTRSQPGLPPGTTHHA